MVVKKYDLDHHTFTALLWIECKRPTGSVQEVETQALDAALRCIAADNLLWIYAITTVGVSFRTWLVENGTTVLQPLHGTTVQADRRQYIGADTDGAYELTKTINLVRTQTPLRQAPVVPSQSVEDYPMNPYVVEHSEQRASSSSYWGAQPGPSSSYAGAQPEVSSSDGGAQPEPLSSYGEAQPGPSSSYVEVSVTRISHTFRADEYLFTDSRNHRKSTIKDDWEQIQYNGEWVWAFHGRRTTYIARRMG